MAHSLVNPPPECIRDFPVGTTFRVEGVLTRNERGERQESLYHGARSTHTVEFSHLAITTSDGAVFEFADGPFPLQYEGGVLENVQGWKAELGETISLDVMVIVDRNLVKRTSLSHHRAQMLVPSSQRQQDDDALRAMVRRQLDKFRLGIDHAKMTEDYAEAREIFAELRRLTMTKQEQKELQRLVRWIPTLERPIYNSHSTYGRDRIEKAYGINYEQYNALDYLAFARKALYGELEVLEGSDKVDQSYLFYCLDNESFTSNQIVDLVFNTLQVRIKRLEQVGDSHDEYWDDQYLVNRCLSYLGTIKDPGSVEALAWVIDYCIERQYFDCRFSSTEAGTMPRRFDSVLAHAIEALAQGAEYSELRAPASFNFGRMQAWNDMLAAYPYMDTVAVQLRGSFFRLFSA